jgi:hypothetical protein
MDFEAFIKVINEKTKLLISVNHPIIDKFASGHDGILSKEYRSGVKNEIDEGLMLDELLAGLGNNFLPSDLVKIFSEGDFKLK